MIGAQAAGAQGYPAEVAVDGEGSPLDIGHKAGLGPPLGVADVIPGVSCLATQLTLGHVFPLCSTSAGNGSVLNAVGASPLDHFDGCLWIR